MAVVAQGFDTGLAGLLRFQIDDALGDVVLVETTVGISEVGDSGTYAYAGAFPSTPGFYTGVFEYGGRTASEQIIVTGWSPPGSGDEDASWAPTVADVARVTPAYTRGGFDDDGEYPGAEQVDYTDTTSPTRAHLEGLIAAACGEIEGRVGEPIPERCYRLARTCAVWHVAAVIAAGKIPADTDDARGEYRAHIANFRNTLDELVVQARQPWALRLR